MEKRKIAIYNLNTYPEMSGGSERSCLELAKELLNLGENVSVVTLTPFRNGFEYFKYNGVDIYKIPLLNLYWPAKKEKRKIITRVMWNVMDIANLPMVLFICTWMKYKGFNIIHTNNIKGASPLIFPFLKLFGFKVVHTTRDYYLLDSGAWYRDKEGSHNKTDLRMKRCIKKLFSKFVDYVIYNSNYMQDYHNKCGFFQMTNNKVIYNGFDPGVYAGREVSLNSGINVFGYIGRMSKEKGVDLLIDGFIKFPKDRFKLIIAGATKQDFIEVYPSRINEIEGRDDIIFLGVIENTEFYKHVDCVVVPSKYNEPFGRVAMEAIFMGKAVIVSPNGGLPEQIISGVNGVVCYDEDYHSSMKDIIRLDMQKNKNDVQPDLTQFTLRHCAKEYLEVYREVTK